MWSFKTVLCNKDCDLKLCKNVDDYIKNFDDCRGTAAVNRIITIGLSMIPLTGISNFYCGNIFDGVFELAEGLIALLSICCGCIYCCDEIQYRNDDSCIPLLVCWSLLLAAISIVRCVVCTILTNSFELYEFSLAMTTVVISLIFCCCGCADRRCLIVSAIVNMIAVGLMEIIRDVYMASYNENDGNGCPFV